MKDAVETNSYKLIKDKVHTFLTQKNNKNGNCILFSCRGIFKTTKVGFYIFGIYGVFAALLNLLIAYLALTSSLADEFRLLYNAFKVPCVLFGALCIAALVAMLLKKEWAASFLSLSAAAPLLIHFFQISKEQFTASYKSQLLLINFLVLLFQLLAVLIIIFKALDKKTEDKALSKAMNYIYERNRTDDNVINEEQLIKAIEDYKPNI